MILKRLVEFADRLEGLPTAGYQRDLVTKAIRLRMDGSLIDVVPLSGATRGKKEGRYLDVPREEPQRTSGVSARLLADNPEYVLGRAGSQRKPGDTGVETRHREWVALVGECAGATASPAVLAVNQWVSDGGPSLLRDSGDWADEDTITFEVEGTLPTDLPEVRAFWAGRGRSYREGHCLVTGEWGPVVDRMPISIMGVPEGQTSGTALVSVNNPSGCSYGLDAGLNSPISVSAATSVCHALNHLLQDARHCLRVGPTAYLAWTRDDVPFDPWTMLRDPDSADMAALLATPWTGREPGVLTEPDLFVLVVSANASRIVVRDQMETTMGEVMAALGAWFRRIRITTHDGSGFKTPGIRDLGTSLYFKADQMPASVPAALVGSALRGTPIPTSLLALAVRRNQAMQGPFVVGKDKKRYLCVERLALIKAVLSQKENQPLETLNVQHPDPAYHCGRLLATLERIQRAALGDINSTVTDRFYGAACTSPGTILGALVNDAQAHLSKLRKEKKAYFHQVALEEILSSIGSSFPLTLTLAGQGLFALGYYHQKAYDRSRAAEHSQTTTGDAE